MADTIILVDTYYIGKHSRFLKYLIPVWNFVSTLNLYLHYVYRRFFSRNGGSLCFALHLETGLPQPPPTHTRRLVAYIFHPSEPFVISIQKAGYSDYVVCFHFRNTKSSNR